MAKAAKPTSLLPAEDARRVISGQHDNPFSVLGPHMVNGVRHVTAFDPAAVKMAAVTEDGAFELTAVQAAPGLFSGPVKGDKPYGLRGMSGDGASWDYEDAYRFGPVLGEMDEYLLSEGTHERLWDVLGAHPREMDGVHGTHFAVWAPNARRVSVVGDFNAWDGRRHVMRRRGATGAWEIFVPGVGEGQAYKYEILGANGVTQPLKADPVGFGSQHPPENTSVVRDISGYG